MTPGEYRSTRRFTNSPPRNRLSEGTLAKATGVNMSSYGVCFNDGTDEPNFCYLAALEVSDLGDIPMEMVAKTMPANTYAIFTHKGSVDELGKTYEYIFETWLPNSNYEIASPYDLEHYDNRLDPENPGNSEMFIWIPFKAKS